MACVYFDGPVIVPLTGGYQFRSTRAGLSIHSIWAKRSLVPAVGIGVRLWLTVRVAFDLDTLEMAPPAALRAFAGLRDRMA
jgi:hypothetical protein